VFLFLFLPAGFYHARNLAFKRQLTKTDPADAEITVKRPRPAAPFAAVIFTGGKLRLLPAFVDHCFSGHDTTPFSIVDCRLMIDD
jgi:hypothetical protein